MPLEGAIEIMRNMFGRLHRTFEILPESFDEVRVCTVMNEFHGLFVWSHSAKVCNILFRDYDVNVVLGMIDMGYHRNDSADGPIFSRGGKRDDAQQRVAKEIFTSVDPVEHVSAADVGRVGVPVQIHFGRNINSNHAKSVDEGEIVRDGQLSDDDRVGVTFDVVEQLLLLRISSFNCH